MINHEQLKTHPKECLDKIGGSNYAEALSLHLKYVSENYNDLDDEVKKIADKQFDLIEQFNKEVFEKIFHRNKI